MLLATTVNQETFAYENIHVLNVHVNIFSWMPHESTLARKTFKFDIKSTDNITG